MKQYEFVVNTGIGDLIHARQLLDSLIIDKETIIRIVLGRSTLGIHWSGDRFNFIKWLAHKLFVKEGYELFDILNSLQESGASSELIHIYDPLVTELPNFKGKILNNFQLVVESKYNFIIVATNHLEFNDKRLLDVFNNAEDILNFWPGSNPVINDLNVNV